MATQHLYKKSYVEKLFAEAEKEYDLQRYQQDNCPFRSDNIFNLIGVNMPEGLESKLLDDPLNDFENAILLYENLQGLTPLQASDERLWVYLAHVDFYKYMYTRWPLTSATNLKDYIKEHWLGKRGLMRHGIANLWWSVYLTVDESNPKDKYILTRFMFQHQDFRTRRFASGVFARNKEGMKGLLTGMMNSNAYDHYFEVRANFAIMYFNHLGGTRQLSALPKEFFINEMKRIDSEVRKYSSRAEVFNNPHLFDNL